MDDSVAAMATKLGAALKKRATTIIGLWGFVIIFSLVEEELPFSSSVS